MNAPVKTNAIDPLLPPADVAKLLKVSLSWLAKARGTRGDGPPAHRGSVVPFVMPKRRCCSG